MRVRRLTAADPPTFTLLMRKKNYYLLYASYAAFVYDLGDAFLSGTTEFLHGTAVRIGRDDPTDESSDNRHKACEVCDCLRFPVSVVSYHCYLELWLFASYSVANCCCFS